MYEVAQVFLQKISDRIISEHTAMEKKSLEGITFKPFKKTDVFSYLALTWASCWMELRDYFLSEPIKKPWDH